MNIVTAIWGNKYSEDYVTALKAQVPNLIVLRPGAGLFEPAKYRGWWCKIEIFRPENEHLRPLLFIDLDTFVLGSLDPFYALDQSKLWLIRNFYQPKKSNSGLFIAPKDTDEIWQQAQRLNLDNGDRGKGDGDFLATFPHELLPDHVNGILSYKVNQLYDAPRDARIVCFHGQPKPADTEGWAKNFWQEKVDGCESEQRKQ